MESLRTREILWVFFLGLLCGVVGETLLFLRLQCRQVEAALSEDFRVLAFLNSDLGTTKAQVLEEKVRAMPGVAEVKYLSRDAVLSFLKERDPRLVQAVSILGENPLGSVLEIRLEPDALPQLAQWTLAASKLPELSDLRFKQAQAQAILQIRFYRHFLDLAISLAALPWFLGAVLGLGCALFHQELPHALRSLPWRLAAACAGTLAGMGMVYAAATPMRSAPLWLWPSLSSQLVLFIAGSWGGGLWVGWRSTAAPAAQRRVHVEALRLGTPV